MRVTINDIRRDLLRFRSICIFRSNQEYEDSRTLWIALIALFEFNALQHDKMRLYMISFLFLTICFYLQFGTN